MEKITFEGFEEKELLKRLGKCLPEKELEKLGKESGFIRRSTSQLTGSNFLLLNIAGNASNGSMSLRESCLWLEEEFGISMRKQSLDERYNSDSVNFMKKCFDHVMQCMSGSSESSNIKFPFSCVQLVDATSFRIPDTLSSYYKGVGGVGGDAMVKIHLNYNLLDNSVLDISFRDGKENDKKYSTGNEFQKNGLYVRDLGYYSSEHFKKISDGKAYFLSRGMTGVNYYIKKGSRFEKLDLESKLPISGCPKEMDVYIKNKKDGYIECRLILEAVPEDVKKNRLTKLDKKEKHLKRWNVSDLRRKLCGYNLFITNASKESLSKDSIRYAYRLRWQIELVFKIWKSIFNIDKVKKMSIHRFECHLYATLISILITLNIQGEIGGFLWNEYEYEISQIKAAGIIKKKFQF